MVKVFDKSPKIFQNKINENQTDGVDRSPTGRKRKLGFKRTSTRLSFKKNQSSVTNSPRMNDVAEPNAKKSKQSSPRPSPNENVVPNNSSQTPVSPKKLDEQEETTPSLKTNQKIVHPTGQWKLRSNKKSGPDKDEVTVKEEVVDDTSPESSDNFLDSEEIVLDPAFWSTNRANNKDLWSKLFDETKISLMQTEFLPKRGYYKSSADCDAGASTAAAVHNTVFVLAEQSYMKGKFKQTEYWVKQGGKQLTQNEWYAKEDVGKGLLNDYSKREKVMEMLEKTMRKKRGETGFARSYPHFKHRKSYLGNDSSKWRLRLREIEEHWNIQLRSTGQAPIYIEDWTGFESPARFKIGSRPASFLKVNRRALNFQYLVQNQIPQDLANELFDYEQRYMDDGTYQCSCEGKCGNCACERFSFVKIKTSKKVEFLEENNPIYTPCGILCKCSPLCKRRVTSMGRQDPLVLFFTGKRGWGVFSAGRIKVGTFLGIYTGELKRPSNLGNTSYQFRIPTILKNNPNDPNEAETELCLESACAANELSLVNHSCENGNIRSFHIANKNRFNLHDIGFVSTRVIEPGEELLYNYFKGSGKGEKDICWCTPHCRNKHFALR